MADGRGRREAPIGHRCRSRSNVKGAPTALVSIVERAGRESRRSRLPRDHVPERRRDREHDGRDACRCSARTRTAEPVHARIAPLHAHDRARPVRDAVRREERAGVGRHRRRGRRPGRRGAARSAPSSAAPAAAPSASKPSGPAPAAHHAAPARATDGLARADPSADARRRCGLLVAVAWFGAELRRVRKRRRVIRLAPADAGVAAATAAVTGVASRSSGTGSATIRWVRRRPSSARSCDAIDRLVGSIGTWRPETWPRRSRR